MKVKVYTIIKVIVYAWMFYLPQIFTLSLMGGIGGHIGIVIMFIVASIGYTIRSLLIITLSVGILLMTLRINLSYDMFNFFRPLSIYGIIGLFLRFINVLFPQFFAIRVIAEQILLILAWIYSYYLLSKTVETRVNSKLMAWLSAYLSGALTFFLLPPPL